MTSVVDWHIHLVHLARSNDMARILDDTLFTIADHEPMNDDYSYLDEVDDHPFVDPVNEVGRLPHGWYFN